MNNNFEIVKEKISNCVENVLSDVCSVPARKNIKYLIGGNLRSSSLSASIIAGKYSIGIDGKEHTFTYNKTTKRSSSEDRILNFYKNDPLLLTKTNNALIRTYAKEINNETVLIADSSTITYKYAKATENISKVYDGASGENVKGFHIHSISMFQPNGDSAYINVHLEDTGGAKGEMSDSSINSIKDLPYILNKYEDVRNIKIESNKRAAESKKEFFDKDEADKTTKYSRVSENVDIMASILRIYDNLPDDIRPVLVCDAGYDRGIMIDFFEEHNINYLIRMNSRNVYIQEGDKLTTYSKDDINNMLNDKDKTKRILITDKYNISIVDEDFPTFVNKKKNTATFTYAHCKIRGDSLRRKNNQYCDLHDATVIVLKSDRLGNKFANPLILLASGHISEEEVIKAIRNYSKRWRVEEFHKHMKKQFEVNNFKFTKLTSIRSALAVILMSYYITYSISIDEEFLKILEIKRRENFFPYYLIYSRLLKVQDTFFVEEIKKDIEQRTKSKSKRKRVPRGPYCRKFIKYGNYGVAINLIRLLEDMDKEEKLKNQILIS